MYAASHCLGLLECSSQTLLFCARALQLHCNGGTIQNIIFASFGTPTGACNLGEGNPKTHGDEHAFAIAPACHAASTLVRENLRAPNRIACIDRTVY